MERESSAVVKQTDETSREVRSRQKDLAWYFRRKQVGDQGSELDSVYERKGGRSSAWRGGMTGGMYKALLRR